MSRQENDPDGRALGGDEGQTAAGFDKAAAERGKAAVGKAVGDNSGGRDRADSDRAGAFIKVHDKSAEPILSFQDLDVQFKTEFGRVHAVRGVSIDVHPGEVVALVGESGSGKTVTSTSALGLLPGNATIDGDITLGGSKLRGMSNSGMRNLRGRDVAMVFQEPMTALNPVLTIGRQMTEALEVHGLAYGKAAMDRAVELLGMVGLDNAQSRVKQFPHELSGGQRQRVVIALAISCNPRVIIADEPTTALDVTVQADILDLLRSLKDKLNTGILLITHSMGVVADMADSVHVMYKGSIVESGSVEAVLNTPAHPYTKRLLQAVPHLGRGREQFGFAKRAGAGSGADAGAGSDAAAHGEVGVSNAGAQGEAGKDDAGSSAAVAQAKVEEGASVQAQAEPGTSQPAASGQSGLVLETKDLVIEYQRNGKKPFRAVDGVSLDIAEGQIVGLVGESGSGKSTIGKCVLGLLPAASGEIRMFGQDILELSPKQARARRKKIGVIFQDPAASLNPRFPVGDCIGEPLLIHKEGSPAQRQARVYELLDAVRLPRSAYNRFPHELSGGQRQRVSIARALALRPSLLIADEPTSALDVSVQAQVLTMLSELQDDFGFACLFISHDLAVVDLLSHSVVVLQNGKVVEAGPREAVLHAPKEEYTRRLLAAAPVPEPLEQRRRRAERHELMKSLGREVSELRI